MGGLSRWPGLLWRGFPRAADARRERARPEEVHVSDLVVISFSTEAEAQNVRKKLFADHLIAYVPLAARIRNVLDERPTHRAPASRFVAELEDYMSDKYADETLQAVTNWGRYGELFAFDEAAQVFSLEDPE
eukprot:gene22865-24158_t